MVGKLMLLLVSPSRLLVELLRDRCGENKDARGTLFRRWNSALFCVEVFVAALCCLVTAHWSGAHLGAYVWPLMFYAWSRINEISLAFYRDAFWHLRRNPVVTNLSSADRVGMALRSYAGLAVNFALLYYFLPVSEKFNDDLGHYGDALYFSFVTITTLGYGDVSPVHALTQALSVYEVLAGVLVLVVAVATYIGSPDKGDA